MDEDSPSNLKPQIRGPDVGSASVTWRSRRNRQPHNLDSTIIISVVTSGPDKHHINHHGHTGAGSPAPSCPCAGTGARTWSSASLKLPSFCVHLVMHCLFFRVLSTGDVGLVKEGASRPTTEQPRRGTATVNINWKETARAIILLCFTRFSSLREEVSEEAQINLR
jgi:hypothetical protein